MKHTNKNHKRRNNKKRQTKKYKGGVDLKGEENSTGKRWFPSFSINNITDKFKNTPSDENSTDLNVEAKKLLEARDKDGNGTLDKTEYGEAISEIPNMPDFDAVAGYDKKQKTVDLHEFTAAYYFAKAIADGNSNSISSLLNKDEYKKLQRLLPGAAKIPYEQVDTRKSGIFFEEFLPLYYFARVNTDGNEKLNKDEYKEIQRLLPGAAEIPYENVDKNGNGIDFIEFLPLYYFARVNGRGPDGNIDDKLSDKEYANLKEYFLTRFKVDSFENVAGTDNKIDFEEFSAKYNELYPPPQPPTGGRRRRKRSTRNKRKSNKKRRTVKRRKSAKKSHRRK